MNKPLVLKIGGSVITDKDGELAPKTEVIARIVEEIVNSEVQNLILVHGGGSFGHPAAQQYRIKDGLKSDTQKIGFAETHHFMTVLNGLFMDALIWHHAPAVSITPLTCIITENGRIHVFEDEALKTLMKLGFMTVLYGDAVLDSKQGFTILSGDQLASALALRFNAERIIMGVDVDGVYESDPKAQKDAKMLSHLDSAELKQLLARLPKPTAKDVTGGMFGKLSELVPAVERGIPVMIVNADKPNNVFKALRAESVQGTLIEKE